MSERNAQELGQQKRLLADEVFRHIGMAIVDETYEPGQRLRDVDLARELHVSRMPVREALQRLERVGLVRMYPSRYTAVSELTADRAAQTREFAGYQAGIVCRLAAERMSDDARSHAAALIDQLINAADDLSQTVRIRWMLLSHLAEHSQNELQQALIRESSMTMFRDLRRWIAAPEHRDELNRVYAALKIALLEVDADEAERLARAMHHAAD